MYARIERTVIDVERRGDIALVFGRQHELPALGVILTVLYAGADGLCLGLRSQQVRIAKDSTVVVRGGQVNGYRLLAILIEKGIGAFHLNLRTLCELVRLSLVKIGYSHVLLPILRD